MLCSSIDQKTRANLLYSYLLLLLSFKTEQHRALYNFLLQETVQKRDRSPEMGYGYPPVFMIWRSTDIQTSCNWTGVLWVPFCICHVLQSLSSPAGVIRLSSLQEGECWFHLVTTAYVGSCSLPTFTVLLFHSNTQNVGWTQSFMKFKFVLAVEQ